MGALRVITEARITEERLERLAYRDEMTGLLNRARLRERVEEALPHIHQNGIPASYLLVNIDNLGMLNDAYGFDVADAVILELSRRIGRTLRQGDVLARVGGNQFGVLLHNCGRNQLLVAAERILSSVRARLVETPGGPLAVSVSVGAVPLVESIASYQAVFGRAEEALEADTAYRSKANLAMLERHGFFAEVQRPKPRGRPMPENIARGNA
ncbi:MAG: GGDEF domain-containing protein, partial [Alphaproteobacteria bacterium]|nr:GGDEF domain-containing protein [Alphaproteobacteria bacterium]